MVRLHYDPLAVFRFMLELSIDQIKQVFQKFPYSYSIKRFSDSTSNDSPFDGYGENSLTIITTQKSASNIAIEDFALHALGMFIQIDTLFFNNTDRTVNSIYSSIYEYIERNKNIIALLDGDKSQDKFEEIISPLKQEIKDAMSYQLINGYLLEDEWNDISLVCEDEESYIFVNWNTSA